MMRRLWLSAPLAGLLLASSASAQTGHQNAPASSGPINSRMTGDIVPTHDPVLVKEDDSYYVYGTGDRDHPLRAKRSPDLIHWTALPPVLDGLPDWASETIPGADTMWAPDLSYWDGKWHLYYAVSTFGSNRSAIGLATSPTLDPDASNYGWRDQGMVVMSTRDGNFNAIDPNHVSDAAGRHWLALGSFWSGIKLFALDAGTGKLRTKSERPHAIAARPTPDGAPSPIEAPYIVHHGDYYYLFVSYDYCCKGVNSTYYTVVGRAKKVTGPYRSRDGGRMMKGRGTIVLRADLQEKERFRGPGHSGFLHDDDGKDYIVYHAYDKQKGGAPTLRISPIRWTEDGWPMAVN